MRRILDYPAEYLSGQLPESKEMQIESWTFVGKEVSICEEGRKPFISPIREDYLLAFRHLAGGVPHSVQLAKKRWTSPMAVAKENCVLPPAGCLSSPVIIHARTPRMPCVITSSVWELPKGTEMQLVKERESELPAPDSRGHWGPCLIMQWTHKLIWVLEEMRHINVLNLSMNLHKS